MNYIEANINFKNNTQQNRDILYAMLGEIEFESFSDTQNGINAYIPSNKFIPETLKSTLKNLHQILGDYTVKITEIEQKNWNQEWENNFEPIFINDNCRIRAPFHQLPDTVTYDIIIEPKMSFGTGHHATTSCMIKLMLDIDFTNKSVLDMGCGTGVLAILAAMKKAHPITAIDIDNWAYLNSIENAEKNHIQNIRFFEGDARQLNNQTFDIILANINRNILLTDMQSYYSALNLNGLILFSGFYTEDLPLIKEKAQSLGLVLEKILESNNWLAVQFKKQK